jgi:hypothetical protein
METCSIEVGLLRKKPCGNAGVAHCLNCEQPMCVEHAVPQLTEGGQKTGKFMCKECTAAAKEHAKSMAGVARMQEQRKAAELDKVAREHAVNPPVAKKPAAGAAAPAAAAQHAPEEAPKESAPLEFTPSGIKKP